MRGDASAVRDGMKGYVGVGRSGMQGGSRAG